MPLTDRLKYDMLLEPAGTHNVQLLDDSLQVIDIVSASFVLATFGQQGDDRLLATGVTFNDVPAGTIIRAFNVMVGTSATLKYIENEEFSGDEASRTVGAAGGNAIITSIEIVNP
jgi:hypothetical protein